MNRAAPDDANLPDFARAVVMRAGTRLHVVLPDPDDADVGVLGRSALIEFETVAFVRLGAVEHRLLDADVRLDDAVGVVLDGVEVVARQALIVSDVEPGVALSLAAARLPDVRAENRPRRAADDVHRRVVVHQLLASVPVHLAGNFARGEFPVREMQNHLAFDSCVEHVDRGAIGKGSLVPELTSPIGVEQRTVEHDGVRG